MNVVTLCTPSGPRGPAAGLLAFVLVPAVPQGPSSALSGWPSAALCPTQAPGAGRPGTPSTHTRRRGSMGRLVRKGLCKGSVLAGTSSLPQLLPAALQSVILVPCYSVFFPRRNEDGFCFSLLILSCCVTMTSKLFSLKLYFGEMSQMQRQRQCVGLLSRLLSSAVTIPVSHVPAPPLPWESRPDCGGVGLLPSPIGCFPSEPRAPEACPSRAAPNMATSAQGGPGSARPPTEVPGVSEAEGVRPL